MWMWTPWGLLLAGALAFAEVSDACNDIQDDYYREIGCRPHEMDKNNCVISYDCSSLVQRSKDHCHYQGRVYNRGQQIEKNPPCLADCHCGRLGDEKDKPSFVCADIECPDLFEGPPREGCYHTYEHGRCCYVEEICEDDAASKTPRTTCEHGGKTYKDGQKFYPEEAPCINCICQSGFNGTLVEPYCHKIQCDLELHSSEHIIRGCVPIYFGTNGCCPFSWRCPDETDSVIAMNSTENSRPSQKSDKMCEFNNLKMRVGDKLNSMKDNPKVKCTCQTPPHPFCVQEENS